MRAFLLLLIGCYQKIFSPLLPRRCRFFPTCSEYARVSLQKHAVHVALWRIGRRLMRCHPWHPGGVDLP